MPELDFTFNELDEDDVFRFADGRVRYVYKRETYYERVSGGGGIEKKSMFNTAKVKVQIS